MNPGSLDGVKLTASASVDGSSLAIDYRIANGSDAPIALLNRIFDLDASGQPVSKPEMAYIDVDGDALVVRKSVQPIPPGLGVAEKVLPWATRVDAGASFEERFVLPIPVKVFHPYLAVSLRHAGGGTHTVVASLARKVTSVKLGVGVVPLSAPIKLDRVSAAGEEPEVFRVSPPGIAAHRLVELWATVALGAGVEALDYEVGKG